jgi:predicted hydrocarbon binding protein
MTESKSIQVSEAEQKNMLLEQIPAIHVRIMFDVFEEILGEHALNAVLRYARMERFINEKPSYALDVFCDSTHLSNYSESCVNVLGHDAWRVISHRTGYRLFKRLMEVQKDLNINQHLYELPVEEGYRERLNLLLSSAGGGGLLEFGLDKIVLSLPNCIACSNINYKKPFCNFWVGVLEALSEVVTGKRAKVVETHCKACGDSSCRFEILSS